MELTTTKEIKAASFNNGLVKCDLQTSLVLTLLSNAIKESRIINKEDIINCYLDFIFYGKEKIDRKALSWSWENYGNQVIKSFSREEVKSKQWYCEQMSLKWFKLHLGSAILKGKILAIPVIEI